MASYLDYIFRLNPKTKHISTRQDLQKVGRCQTRQYIDLVQYLDTAHGNSYLLKQLILMNNLTPLG